MLLGNHQECSIKGIGSVLVKMFDNQVRELSSVRYVPDLKRNLISLGVFDKAEYICKLENDSMKIIKGAMVKARGSLQNGLYVLEGSTTNLIVA